VEIQKTNSSKSMQTVKFAEITPIIIIINLTRNFLALGIYVIMKPLEGHLKNIGKKLYKTGINLDISTNPILHMRKSIVDGSNGIKQNKSHTANKIRLVYSKASRFKYDDN
jgi:hypothetical protein